VPQDIPFQNGRILYTEPPYGFQCATGWIDIFHDNRFTGMSKVEIDYLHIWQHVDDQWLLLAQNPYNEADEIGGGVFLRDPWFGNNKHFDFLSYLDDGILILYPGFYPDKLLHIWNSRWPRKVIDPTADQFKAETRLRITGPVQVRLGMDFWRSPEAEYKENFENNHEAGSTDWYCQQNNSWQTITLMIQDGLEITSPLRINPSTNVIAGDELYAEFTLTNRFNYPIHIDSIVTATRFWIDQTLVLKKGFSSVTHVTLEPGQSYTYSQKYLFNTHGRFAFFPYCYFSNTWVLPAKADTVFVTVKSPTIIHTDQNSSAQAALHCFPNPFNCQTRFLFFLPHAQELRLKIININGQTEKEYYFPRHPQGRGAVLWNGRDRFGHPVSSGIYWIQMLTDDFVRVAKVIVLR
jgi:hypothetical protein